MPARHASVRNHDIVVRQPANGVQPDAQRVSGALVEQEKRRRGPGRLSGIVQKCLRVVARHFQPFSGERTFTAGVQQYFAGVAKLLLPLARFEMNAVQARVSHDKTPTVWRTDQR